MKKILIALLFLITVNVKDADATNLRGRLVTMINGQYRPIASARVDILFKNGQNWVPFSYAVTGEDGFYYFVNVPPGNSFCILIEGRYYPPQALLVQNIPPNTYQDIPLIVN